MDDQTIRARLEFLGGEGADKLRDKVGVLHTHLAMLVKDFTEGKVAQDAFDKEMKEVTAELRLNEKALKFVEDATKRLAAADRDAAEAAKSLTGKEETLATGVVKLAGKKDQLAKSTEKASRGMAGFGQAGMQAGRVIQDLTQGGIGGILNNIEGSVLALGGGPGLAGVLTMVGVAAFILRPHLTALGEAIGLFGNAADAGKTKVEILKERIDELTKKPVKLAADYAELDQAEKRLDRMQKALAAFEAGRRTLEMDDLGGRATKTVRESMGSEGFEKAVFESNKGRSFGSKEDDTEIARLNKANEFHRSQMGGAGLEGARNDAMAEAAIEKNNAALALLADKLDQAAHEYAKKQVGAFMTGDIGAVGEMKGLAARNPGAFDKESRKSLGMLPSNSEEWAAMRKGGRDSAKESEDITRKHAMREADSAAEEETQTKFDEAWDAAIERLKTSVGGSLRANTLTGIARNQSDKEILAANVQTASAAATTDKAIPRDLADSVARSLAKSVTGDVQGELGGKDTTPAGTKPPKAKLTAQQIRTQKIAEARGRTRAAAEAPAKRAKAARLAKAARQQAIRDKAARKSPERLGTGPSEKQQTAAAELEKLNAVSGVQQNQASALQTNEAILNRLNQLEQDNVRLKNLTQKQTSKARTRAPSVPGY